MSPQFCRGLVIALLAWSPTLGSGAERARPSAVSGRELLEQHAASIVEIEFQVMAVVAMNGRPMPPRTQSREVNGMVITPSGLTATSLSMMDPRAAPSGSPNMRIEQTELGNINFRLVDGTRIPARIVLKKEKLDLIFIAPEKDTTTEGIFSPVPWENAVEPEILELCYDISRAPGSQQRAPMIRVLEVVGLVGKFADKPRFILTSQPASPGCPVFVPDGKFLGIGTRFPSDGSPAAPGILPATELAAAVRQAITAMDHSAALLKEISTTDALTK